MITYDIDILSYVAIPTTNRPSNSAIYCMHVCMY